MYEGGLRKCVCNRELHQRPAVGGGNERRSLRNPCLGFFRICMELKVNKSGEKVAMPSQVAAERHTRSSVG